MAYSFDSLGYAKRLRDRGVPNDQAEAHAEAARDFIMPEIATKADVLALKTDLLATEQRLRAEFRTGITELQTEVRSSITGVRTSISELQTELRTRASQLDTRIDTQTVQLTVRLGALIVVGIGVLATIMKLS